MKLVSALNMSPSGMRLHFYSLTLRELKLISWTCRLSEAPAAGCGLSTAPARKTFPSSHLIQGLDLIKDLSWTTSATAVQSHLFTESSRGIYIQLMRFCLEILLILPRFMSTTGMGYSTLENTTLVTEIGWLQWTGERLALIAFKNPLKWHSATVIG